MAGYRWIRPEVYPLLAPVGFAIGICIFQLYRNITGNPDVRVNKKNRNTTVPENYEEGERYREHGVRKYLRKAAPEILPSMQDLYKKT